MKKRLLIVDDDREICDIISEVASMSGFDVQCAEDYTTLQAAAISIPT